MASGMAAAERRFCQISFSPEELEEKTVVGVVYVITNDYHAQQESALRSYGIDLKNMEHFFNACDDKYYVVSERHVTSKEFWASCQYLANSDYPPSCDRIIIYFAGHGKDGYILMDKDYASIEKNTKLSESAIEERVIKESKIDLNILLSLFRKPKIKENMSVILLLDACCNAQAVKCEGNELVASAGSGCSVARSDRLYGGYWTITLLLVFNATDEVDIVNLLKDVQKKMENGMHRDENNEPLYLYPTFTQKLTRQIWFRKRM